MKLQVAIAEDEQLMRILLKKALELVEEVEIIFETDNGRDLVEYVELYQPHAVFLDIEMPGLNGLEAAKEIVDICPNTALVFVTGFPEHMSKAFELYVFDYLVKPFSPERIRQTVMRILNAEKISRKAALYELSVPCTEPAANPLMPRLAVSSNGGKVFLDQNDIILITRDKRKTLIYTVNYAESIRTNDCLKNIFNRLNKHLFFRSHRSYIVNLNYVERLDIWGTKSNQISMKHTSEKGLVSHSLIKEMEERLSGKTSPLS